MCFWLFEGYYHVESQTSQNHGNVRRKSLDVIHRIYGEENAKIRAEVQNLEQGAYWNSGIRSESSKHVKYENHPFDQMGKNQNTAKNRGLLESSNSSLFNKMRITFETKALDSKRTPENAVKVDFIKNEILRRTGDFWSEALGVVPVKGNLFIETNDLRNRKYCGDEEFSEVPSNHIADGISNTDLMLYISASSSTRFCGSNTLAVAVACNFDQFDRPTAGAVNFCLNQIQVGSDGVAPYYLIDDNVDVAIHEVAHVLGMSSNSYRFFRNPETGKPRTSRPFSRTTVTCVDDIERTLFMPNENTLKLFTADNGQRYASIVTPKVQTVVRNQFDCQELEGAQLENQPTGSQSCTGDHWDERLFYPESMSGIISPNANILSPVTLAMLEDTGWYEANYGKSRVSPWGLSAGCDFVYKDCLNKRTGKVPDYGKGYFCDYENSRGCSPSHLYKMACSVVDYSINYNDDSPGERFQYFPGKPHIGGPVQADFCPVYGSTYGGRSTHQLDCRDSDNYEFDPRITETYGEDSMCFETDKNEGRCFKTVCALDTFSVKVEFNKKWYECNKDFDEIDTGFTSGSLIPFIIKCPRISSVCPDMFCPANCAGRGACNYSANFNGTIRPKCECFDKSDTSQGCTISLELDGRYLDDTSSLVSLSDEFFSALIAVFIDHPDKWTIPSWSWCTILFFVFLLLIMFVLGYFFPDEKRK